MSTCVYERPTVNGQDQRRGEDTSAERLPVAHLNSCALSGPGHSASELRLHCRMLKSPTCGPNRRLASDSQRSTDAQKKNGQVSVCWPSERVLGRTCTLS